MWDWLTRHGDSLDLVISFAMLVVWLIYLQLFLQSYRRARRAKILINRGVGSGLGSRCLLSNMSAEAIYIHSLVARLGDSDQQVFAAVTDLVGEDATTQHHIRDATIQGPVESGAFLDVGTFESILRRAGWTSPPPTQNDAQASSEAETEGAAPERPCEIELAVLATYASEDLIVGAKRRFDIEQDQAGWVVSPRTADTQQIRSRRQRRALERAYHDYLN